MIGDVGTRVTEWWGPALAFAAGVVSFASPCVLPLVPGYLSFVTGDRSTAEQARRPIVPILLFILGFSLVFTLVFGFTASAAREWFLSPTGRRVAGGFVLVFGVFLLLYAVRARIPWLYWEGRPFLARVRPGSVGALPLGMAFAVGWAPCIGPVLGAVTTLASNQGSTPRVVFLLFMYSMGLGVPFLLVGLGIERLMGAFKFFSRNYHWFAAISGVAMCTIGILLLTGRWNQLIAPLLRAVNRFVPVL
ncbi:MAG: cytochrome c biogenesis CcdA family protein [Actinomycetota bacterium]